MDYTYCYRGAACTTDSSCCTVWLSDWSYVSLFKLFHNVLERRQQCILYMHKYTLFFCRYLSRRTVFGNSAIITWRIFFLSFFVANSARGHQKDLLHVFFWCEQRDSWVLSCSSSGKNTELVERNNGTWMFDAPLQLQGALLQFFTFFVPQLFMLSEWVCVCRRECACLFTTL